MNVLFIRTTYFLFLCTIKGDEKLIRQFNVSRRETFFSATFPVDFCAEFPADVATDLLADLQRISLRTSLQILFFFYDGFDGANVGEIRCPSDVSSHFHDGFYVRINFAPPNAPANCLPIV